MNRRSYPCFGANVDYGQVVKTYSVTDLTGTTAGKHVESVPVKEVFRGQTVWDGVIEVFDLTGHPKAKRGYAWGFKDGKETRFIAILEISPVDSPVTALRAAIASKAQK